MKERIKKLIIFLLIISFFVFAENTYALTAEYIDVSIGKIGNGHSINLSSENGFELISKSNKILNWETSENNIKIIYRANSGDVLDNNGNKLYTIDFNTEAIGSKTGVNNLNGKKYRGYITGVNGNIINHINIDEYLYGVLTREMSPSFSMEALKAQAVASRSFAIYSKNKHANEGFNLCNTTHCQVYGGLDGENPKTNQAVEETKEEMVYFNGQLAETLFHSNNGGIMESSRNVWGGNKEYLVVKDDPYSLNTNNSSWEFKISKTELSNKLANRGYGVGTIQEIEITDISPANRVNKLKLIGTGGTKELKGSDLRSVLGPVKFKSTYFSLDNFNNKATNTDDNLIYVINGYNQLEIISPLNFVYINSSDRKSEGLLKDFTILSKNKEKSFSNNKIESTAKKYQLNDQIIFYGRGYGHGVGMSQWGAEKMAKEGFNYREIIKHYYLGVDIY